MKTNLTITYTVVALLSCLSPLHAAELHVAISGDDAHPGTPAAPLRTIQRAAELAQPGDVVTVHEGVYREWVHPPHGGVSDARRITFQATRGEKVEIRGSEVVTNWVKVQDDVWKTTVPNTLFGGFNPYGDLIHGDWFNPQGRQHHTGSVYLNGEWLTEAAKLEDVLKPTGKTPLWFGQVDQDTTTLWAQFKGVNPNEQLVEINVRRAVFYPAQPGRNYITVRGLRLSQAATPWAPPTAEQVGLLGTHWSKGWLIESNVVSYSICSGISLGKYGDEWDNTSANTAEGYVKTIERALKNGWNKETIGHHVVRNNIIFHCEQAGIVGSLGAAFSTVTGNDIHDIHVRRLFSGAEMAGIKFHAAIDTVIRGNHISGTGRGLWLDWMAQGTRVSGNLFHDNASEDLFVEVDHGPFIVDNNLFLSGSSLLAMSECGASVRNLFAGKLNCRPEPARATPFHPAHSTALAGLVTIKGGDDRFYNNIFIGNGVAPVPPSTTALQWISGFGLWMYDRSEFPLQTGGNVFYHAAQPFAREDHCLTQAGFDPKLRVAQENGHVMLQLNFGPEIRQAPTVPVTSARLGQARVPGVGYENPDWSAVKFDTDYFGKRRSKSKPCPGPFEVSRNGELSARIW